MRNIIYYCNQKRTMKSNVRWCLVHLTLLLCFCAELTSCAPARKDDASTVAPPIAQPPNAAWEETRQLWNGVRQLRKELSRRQKREAQPTPTSRPDADDIDLDNVEAPAYVKELYVNLTKQSKVDDTTLIRSLTAMHPNTDVCGFNFTLNSVSAFELFKRAELRVYMKHPSPDLLHPIHLQLFRNDIGIVHKTVSPAREGWVVFDVLDEINRLKPQLREHPHRKIRFTIKAYDSTKDLVADMNGKDCNESPVEFEQNSESHPPLLMIYSYDPDAVKLNISALFENISSNSTSLASADRERRNSPSPSPSCDRHNLEITLSQFNDIWRSGSNARTALYPPTFNLGVCGGVCNNRFPVASPQHAVILYYLASRGHPVPSSFLEWKQCCAPVKYRSFDALFSLPNDEYQIIPLQELSVERCACMNFVR